MSLGSSAPCDLARELARRGLARTTTSAYLVSGATQPNRTAYIVKLTLELGPLVQRRQSRTMASAHAEKTYTYTTLHLQLHLSCSYVAHQRKQAAGPPFWRCENARQQSPNVAQHPRWNNLGSCTAACGAALKCMHKPYDIIYKLHVQRETGVPPSPTQAGTPDTTFGTSTRRDTQRRVCTLVLLFAGCARLGNELSHPTYPAFAPRHVGACKMRVTAIRGRLPLTAQKFMPPRAQKGSG